ncbi:MAG: sodium:proton antiporter [Ignavibacteria bacterium]|nr:sodium:proton antiporter [Ignavibacteria bacterium]
MEFLLFIPFIVLLLSIAFMPFIAPTLWHKHYGKFSITLALFMILFYLLVLKKSEDVIRTAEEYISFICLLGSLYTVSGGIYFTIKGRATPFKNALTLFFGSVMANFFGTTGAAMLLIRPYINSNKNRLKPYHIIFFIFTVCNTGGALTPIGDPPLFLGYLKGIPFFWIIGNLYYIWFFALFYILLVFYIIDKINYEKLRKDTRERIEEKGEDFEFRGLYNVIFLLIIIASVFITKPLFVREALMISCAVASYKLTPVEVHRKNKFNFEPIKEVALLFIGIFMTMMPVLGYLSVNAENLGIDTVTEFYWYSGFFTSFLDNAPTYLNFLTAEMGLMHFNINNPNEVLLFIDKYKIFVIAISVSSVFFGAMTYIGNGPNFMVKSIAENKGIKMPGFFPYIYKYSLPILIPAFFVIWYIFFR